MASIHLDLDRDKFPPVGRCIYCGSDGGGKPLGSEHIVPYSLGGNVRLEKASCANCATITSQLERYAAREIFELMRSFLRIQSRSDSRKKSTRQDYIPIIFVTERGEETRQISRAEAPPLLILPVFKPPGIIDGQQPTEVFRPSEAWAWYSSAIEERTQKMKRPGDKSWRIGLNFKADVFCRFLAKMAHTMTIAHFGIDSFKPMLPAIIRGLDKNIPYLIGGESPPTQPVSPLPAGKQKIVGYAMTMGMLRNSQTDHRLLATTVRLFPFTGSPTYCAIVGEPGQQIREKLDEQTAG